MIVRVKTKDINKSVYVNYLKRANECERFFVFVRENLPK